MPERLKAFDTHFHTRNGPVYEFKPHSFETIVQELLKRDLGIFQTNHDTFWGYEEFLEAAAQYGIEMMVGPGVEITSRFGHRMPHIGVIGIEPGQIRYSRRGNPKIPSLKNPRKVIEWAHELGGVAIAVHPTPYESMNSLTYNEIRDLANEGFLVDGIEVSSLRGYSLEADKLAVELELARIGGSDTHASLKMLGKVYTLTKDECLTWRDFIEAIKYREVWPIIEENVHAIPINERVPRFARMVNKTLNLLGFRT